MLLKIKEVRKAMIMVLLVLVFFVSGSASAQILVTGTSFDPTPGNAGRTYIGLNDIVHYGIQTGSITSTPPIAPNVNAGVFNATPYYAITDNPYKLDNTLYANLATPDYQYVYSPKTSGSNTNILEYVVKGMLPGSPVSVVVNYCSAVSATNASCTGQRNEFKAGINLDSYNQLNGNDASQIGMGECKTSTFTGTVAANGDMIFRMNNTQTGSCKAMGVTKIEVFGSIKPVIVSNMGTEVCVGEQISLQPTQHYNASYQWQVNSGSGWTNISAAAGGTNESLLYEVTTVGSYNFRLNVSPLPSGTAVTTDQIAVTAITCCVVGSPPVSASRQTVYYDDFGQLDLADKTGKTYYVWDYTNVLNPVRVARTTATPFRWPLSPAPLAATFVGTSGALQDGQYAVAAYLTGYNSPINGYDGAKLEWANRVKGLNTIPNPDLSYDHSGAPEGAALFLNCPPNTGGQTLYSRTISNLCFGKQLFFEAWIAVFTNSASGAYNPVNVLVRLTEVGNPGNVVTSTATATREADGGGVWVRVAAQINLVTGNSLLMEIVNNQNVSANGNDLVLDDIKIMACSPPGVNLYFDLAALSETTTICTTGDLNLATKGSALLKSFYGNNPLYLYQWTRTPSVVSSWQNFGAPGTPETFTLTNVGSNASFSGLTDGGKVYFRVISATAATFTANTNFQAPNYANANDPCKSYSVSDPIEATVACPLPVNLLHFTGWKSDNANQFTWSTSSESDNDYFVIERSIDGQNFVEIGRVKGNGTTTIVSNYNFDDLHPQNGVNYYRLKQVDLDGKFAYSRVVLIDNASDISSLDIYPNPNNGNFDIRITSEGANQSYHLEVLDVQGKVVYSGNGNQAYETIQISNLSSGVYAVRLSAGSDVIVKKLLVY